MKTIRRFSTSSILDEDITQFIGADVVLYVFDEFPTDVNICVGDVWFADQKLKKVELDKLIESLRMITCFVNDLPSPIPPGGFKLDLPIPKSEDLKKMSTEQLLKRAKYYRALSG